MTNIINYFQSSIWTIVSFIMVTIIILIPLLSFLSYSFFTVDNVEIIHEFSLYKSKIKLPITEKIGKEIVTLPTHPNITEKDLNKIIKTVNQFL